MNCSRTAERIPIDTDEGTLQQVSDQKTKYLTVPPISRWSSREGVSDDVGSTADVLLREARCWDLRTPYVALSYNCALSSGTKETPNFLMFARDLRIPGELMTAVPTFSYGGTRNCAEDIVMRMQEAFRIVKDNLETAGSKARPQRKRMAPHKDIKVFDAAYLFTPNLRRG